MEKLKKLLDRIFIDGLTGMAQGLFATLIVGTIIQQIGSLIGGNVGDMIFVLGKMAATFTGAGIGVGVAYRFKESPLVVLSAATAGMVGAFAAKLLAGSVLVDGAMVFAGPGEPLGAFLAAYVGIEFGHLVSGKTKVDILVTPIVTITAGSAVGLLVGPPISEFMTALGALINWGTEQQPFLMGIIVSVLMGMILTLPISSAALGVILNLSGLAAGAATIGCCCNMVGFAVASYRENKIGGLLAQGIGTSMLQVPNIVRANYLGSCNFIKCYLRTCRNDDSAHDKQCDRLWNGNSRTCRTDYDMADDDGSGAADDRTYKNYRDTDCPSGDCDTAHFRIYEKEKMDSVWRYEIRIIRADEEKLSKKSMKFMTVSLDYGILL